MACQEAWAPISTAPKECVILLRDGARIAAGLLKWNSQHRDYYWQIIARRDGAFSSAIAMGFEPREWMDIPKESTHAA
jgi:hypothetical protein